MYVETNQSPLNPDEKSNLFALDDKLVIKDIDTIGLSPDKISSGSVLNEKDSSSDKKQSLTND